MSFVGPGQSQAGAPRGTNPLASNVNRNVTGGADLSRVSQWAIDAVNELIRLASSLDGHFQAYHQTAQGLGVQGALEGSLAEALTKINGGAAQGFANTGRPEGAAAGAAAGFMEFAVGWLKNGQRKQNDTTLVEFFHGIGGDTNKTNGIVPLISKWISDKFEELKKRGGAQAAIDMDHLTRAAETFFTGSWKQISASFTSKNTMGKKDANGKTQGDYYFDSLNVFRARLDQMKAEVGKVVESGTSSVRRTPGNGDRFGQSKSSTSATSKIASNGTNTQQTDESVTNFSKLTSADPEFRAKAKALGVTNVDTNENNKQTQASA